MTDHRRRRAELLPPERVADHHHVLGTGCIVAAADNATQLRGHTEELEELARHPGCTQRHWLARIEHYNINCALKRHTRDRLECTRPFPYGTKFGVCERQMFARCRRRVPRHEDVLRLMHRQCTQRDSVKDTECRRRGADTDGKRANRNRSKHRIPPQCAKGESDVEPHVLHHRQPTCAANRFGMLSDTAKGRDGTAPGFIRVVAGTNILCRFHLEMKTKLFRQPLILGTALKELPEAGLKPGDPAHAAHVMTWCAAADPSRRRSAASSRFQPRVLVDPAE